MHRGILVLDFGSQYTQLIARRLRELGVYTEILPFDEPLSEIKARAPYGIVLSGGPHSVFDPESPKREVRPLVEIAPVLGICYGMQLIAQEWGGQVEPAEEREYGLNAVTWVSASPIEASTQTVWMSHGDVVRKLPEGFELWGESKSQHPAAIKGSRVWALQFHPEVTHTEQGDQILSRFISELAEAPRDWKPSLIKEELIAQIQSQVGDGDHVLCALSGGVDSSVVGTLLTQALGAERVHCVFVNNGLLRKDEFDQVLALYQGIGLNVLGVDAKSQFLDALKGVSDPEQKRKIIGKLFIDVFKQEIAKTGLRYDWLAQGTLYPDVIESVAPRGTSVTIKSHHNVGGLPKDLNLKLVEPLRELFKDEVRAIGKELGLPEPVLWRHPFPGPGLAIRVLGEVTEPDLATLREADAIYVAALREFGLYEQIWQAFSVLLPVRTVGVQGDGRSYEKVLALRAVVSKDGMTADWFDLPTGFLREVSNRITNRVKGVNRVVYDITSKPPGTIEWE